MLRKVKTGKDGIITIKDIEKKLKGLTSAFYRGQSLFTS